MRGGRAIDAEGQWWGVITMMSLFQRRVPVEMAEVVVRRVAAWEEAGYVKRGVVANFDMEEESRKW